MPLHLVSMLPSSRAGVFLFSSFSKHKSSHWFLFPLVFDSVLSSYRFSGRPGDYVYIFGDYRMEEVCPALLLLLTHCNILKLKWKSYTSLTLVHSALLQAASLSFASSSVWSCSESSSFKTTCLRFSFRMYILLLLFLEYNFKKLCLISSNIISKLL